MHPFIGCILRLPRPFETNWSLTQSWSPFHLISSNKFFPQPVSAQGWPQSYIIFVPFGRANIKFWWGNVTVHPLSITAYRMYAGLGGGCALPKCFMSVPLFYNNSWDLSTGTFDLAESYQLQSTVKEAWHPVLPILLCNTVTRVSFRHVNAFPTVSTQGALETSFSLHWVWKRCLRERR